MEGYKVSERGDDGLVSIIIPTHNRCNLVLETVDSLLNQTYKNIELLIIDDHSTDKTKECIAKYTKQYSFIRYFQSKRSGACAARNLGISKARGEYIQFMDDDDVVHRDFIRKRLNVLVANEQIGFVTCNMYYFQGDLSNRIKFFKMDDIPHDINSHLLKSALPAPLFLFRRSTILSIGFWDEDCLRFQDIRYYHRLFLNEIQGVWLPDYLYYVRVHQHSISKNVDARTLNSLLGVYRNIRKEWIAENKLTKRLSRILCLLSFSVILQNWHENKIWAIKNIVFLILKDIDGFGFFLRFLFLRITLFKKAIDIY